ncbi:MAG: hypothetical protein FWB95_08230, partial [Treponema sp.]|nr:hypothetical protein [Treponema sp.]
MDISGSGSSSSSVLIRLAGSNGRTVMPAEPVFSRYELSIQKGAEVITADADRVTGEGVTVVLSEGTWMITLNAYQNINGKNYLAAKGTYQLSVNSSQTSYTVVMELNPIAIEDAAVDNGIFSFNFTIPFDAGTAVLSLKNNNGNLIEEINLISTGSGSKELAPGYYDMSVILTRDDQYAGMFESVHIYSGLESPAVFNISDITFAEKIYLAGSLGGIRIGTVKVTFDEAGTDILKMTELERDTVKRGDFWFIDIPAVNIGRKVYVILEFYGQAVKKEIPFLDAKGSAEIDLNLYPASVKYINLADWYSTLTTSELDITADFGFDITANFFRLTFNDGSNYIKFLPQAVTATKFKASDFTAVSLPITGFEIFNAADRSGLINAIEEAQTISNTFRWFTTAEYTGLNDAIITAQNVYPDPLLTDDQINSVTAALNDIKGLFSSGRDAVWLSSGYSYSTITVNWKEANTANVYRLIYKYANEWDWTDVKWDNADTFNRDGDNYSWTFRPRGYNEIANSGKVLQAAVLAVHTFDDGNIEYLTSNIVEKRLVGPSELNINATMASFADSINVSWNAVDGANGYYVSRRQFGANNNTPTGAEKMYFVTSNSVATVSADTVNTSVSTSNTESRFTLHDAYLTDDVEEESFSYHYHYLVIPVINAGDFMEYDNYSYTLQENGEAITYVNAVSLEQKGFAIGFARNVTATKGTYASSGNINDGILITWDKPLHLGDAGLQY